jgi:hypothetical protein
MSDKIKDKINSLIEKLEKKAVEDTISFIKKEHSFHVSFSYHDHIHPHSPVIKFDCGDFWDSEVFPISQTSPGYMFLPLNIEGLLRKTVSVLRKEDDESEFSTKLSLLAEEFEKSAQYLRSEANRDLPTVDICDDPNCPACPPVISASKKVS